MKRWGKAAANIADPNTKYLEYLKLLAETSSRLNQMETSEEMADLLCKQVKACL